MVPQLTRAIMMMQMINCGRCKYFKQNDTEAANFDAKLLGFAKNWAGSGKRRRKREKAGKLWRFCRRRKVCEPTFSFSAPRLKKEERCLQSRFFIPKKWSFDETAMSWNLKLRNKFIMTHCFRVHNKSCWYWTRRSTSENFELLLSLQHKPIMEYLIQR